MSFAFEGVVVVNSRGENCEKKNRQSLIDYLTCNKCNIYKFSVSASCNLLTVLIAIKRLLSSKWQKKEQILFVDWKRGAVFANAVDCSSKINEEKLCARKNASDNESRWQDRYAPIAANTTFQSSSWINGLLFLFEGNIHFTRSSSLNYFYSYNIATVRVLTEIKWFWFYLNMMCLKKKESLVFGAFKW